MEKLKKEIHFYCQDIVKPFTVRRCDDVELWIMLDDKKFKAHMAISNKIFSLYNEIDIDNYPEYYEYVKFIHDDIQFITSNLYKSIGLKIKDFITLTEIENYADKLANTIIEYLKSQPEDKFVIKK